jgi:ribose 5-phosphate isomerase B
MNSNVLWIANDHGGYKLKLRFVDYLTEKGYDVKDIGCHSEDIVRYPHYAAKVAQAISHGDIERGILICSTGIGMSIIANKFKGVRAALCTSTYMSKMTRMHNDSNILCIGGKITGEFEALDFLETWLNTEFEGGRHCISLGLIEEAENAIFNPGGWEPDF